MKKGTFVISLDFEIFWGVRDVLTLDQYRENLAGVRQVIPSLVDLFNRYNVTATFGTVGLLFFKNKTELLENLPAVKPNYKDQNLSPYPSLEQSVGEDESSDIFHYAPSLINIIKQGGHEVGSHTFCHYYCLEEGQTITEFEEDLKAAVNIAQKRNLQLTSFIFPRHQFNKEYLAVCSAHGITSFRGNQTSWVHKPLIGHERALLRRSIRILDTYINILGHDVYQPHKVEDLPLVNIPASRFLRPYSKKLEFLDGLRLKRIRSSMTYAAKKNGMYHLWWHPHNFGVNLKENLDFLEKILRHYSELHNSYAFESLSMHQIAENILAGN